MKLSVLSIVCIVWYKYMYFGVEFDNGFFWFYKFKNGKK